MIGGYTLEASYGLMLPLSALSDFIPFTNNPVTSTDDVKRVILVCCLYSSFICWLQVIRNCIHLGYTVDGWDGPVIPYDFHPLHNPSTDIPHDFGLVERKARYKRYGNFLARNIIVYFSFAFRFLYISIPFVFYSVGPTALIISTCGILALEVAWDYQLIK